MSDDKISFEELDMTFGQMVEVMPKQSATKEFSDVLLLGVIPGESLILSAPESGVFPKMVEGEKVVFRVKLADGVALFASNVLFIADVPMFMVYVDFPHEISFKRIRQATRVQVSLPILLSNLSTGKQTGVTGRVVDISTAGAGIETDESLGNQGEKVVMKGKFTVGTIQRVLSISGMIRKAQQKSPSLFVYGLEFLEDDENDLLVLFGFIFNAMAFGKIQKIR